MVGIGVMGVFPFLYSIANRIDTVYLTLIDTDLS